MKGTANNQASSMHTGILVLCALLFSLTSAQPSKQNIARYEKSIGECGYTLSCNASISIKRSKSNVQIWLGFKVKNKTLSTDVPAGARAALGRKTIVDMHNVTEALLEMGKSNITANNCRPDRDFIAMTLQAAVFKMSQNKSSMCERTNMPACTFKSVVTNCTSSVELRTQSAPNDVMRHHLPWEGVLAPKPLETDPLKGMDSEGNNFNIFTKFLRFSGLYDAVTSAKGITLLLPSDDAFIRCARHITGIQMLKDHNRMEMYAYDKLKEVANKGWTKAVSPSRGRPCRLIIAYHIIIGPLSASRFEGTPFYINTANALPIYSIGTGEIIDLSPHTPNPRLVYKDMSLVNDVTLHTLNQVLIPIHIEADLKKVHECK
eukprot:IDg18034t1